MEERIPGWLRVAYIVLGILGMVLGALALALPEMTVLVALVLFAVGLLFLGASQVLRALRDTQRPGWRRAVDVVLGALALILWTIVIAFPGLGQDLLLLLVAFALLIYGIDRIAFDALDSSLPGWTRGVDAILGGVAIAVGVLMLGVPGMAELVLIVLFALVLFINGIGAIIAGLVGERFRPSGLRA